MIQLPPGFDVAQLVSDLISMAAPFVPVILTVSVGFLIIRILRRV